MPQNPPPPREIIDTGSTAGMFSYPSSPLFEQPFVNHDFYAEQIPLRSRGGGGGSSSNSQYSSSHGGSASKRENDAFFSPSNPYFTSPHRRRKRTFFQPQFSPDRWVKHIMRLVLLSPLIVLVLWSISAVLFTTSSSSLNRPKAQATMRKPLKQQQQQRPLQQRQQRPQPLQPTRKRRFFQLTQPADSDSQSTTADLLKEGLLEVVELSGDLLGEAQPQNLVATSNLQLQPLLAETPPEELQLQPLLTETQSEDLQLQPLLTETQPEELQPQQPLGETMPEELQQLPPLGDSQLEDFQLQPPLLGTQPEELQGLMQLQQFPMNPLGAKQPQHLQHGGGSSSQTSQLMHNVEHTVEQYLHPKQPQTPTQHSHSKRLNLLPSSQNNIIVQPQHYVRAEAPLLAEASPPRGSSWNLLGRQKEQQPKKVVYYYYDPQAARVGPNGQMYLPPVVYDQAGNLVPTNQIGRGGTTQVLIQPPPRYGSTVHHTRLSSSLTTSTLDDSNNDTSQSFSTTRSGLDEGGEDGLPPRPLLVTDPVRGIAFPSNLKDDLHSVVQRAEDRYQESGSSVIVATVAVMALLVGALSARRLRGRPSILNSCIENERLDHMNAVDDTATETNQATAYSTFNWKGDLEKFDV